MELKAQIITKFCDFKTFDNEWRLGIIENTKGTILKDKDLLEVHLDGWSINKNQVNQINKRKYAYIHLKYNHLDIIQKVILDK